MELLAPAGSGAALAAAVKAGADAVYLGAGDLNARRGADNLEMETLPPLVRAAKARGIKVYLALNIDLGQRDLGATARWLRAAGEAGVAAVIVRDPGALWLWHALARDDAPWPALHFSTQTACANGEDVRAAGHAGARRVVLARELTLAELRAAASAGAEARTPVEIEVFVHGALCFCVSGRCLLSSWGGGRSGNRGVCVSPCRAPWRRDGDAGAAFDTPMSMHDLALAERLDDLWDAGVAALKIEGRLKSAAWVEDAVSLYRSALRRLEDGDSGGSGDDSAVAIRERIERLGRYAGRQVGQGYVDGAFAELTGNAARPSTGTGSGETTKPAVEAMTDGADGITFAEWAGGGSGTASEAAGSGPGGPAGAEAEPDTPPIISLISGEPGGVAVSCVSGERTESLRLPRTVVKRPEKAARAGDWAEQFAAHPPEGLDGAGATTDDPDFLLPPRNVNALDEWLIRIGRQRLKEHRRDGPSAGPGVGAPARRNDPLPDTVSVALHAATAHPDNRRDLSGRPNRIRLSPEQAFNGLDWLPDGVTVVVDGALDGPAEAPATRDDALWGRVRGALGRRSALWALPPVLFEADLPAARALVAWARERGDGVECNSWGGWGMCAAAGVKTETGPGLGVLNGLASRYWHEAGAWATAVSLECDRRKLAELCPGAAGRLVAWRRGRPLLAVSRAATTGDDWEDRRGIRLTARRTRGVTEFHAAEPYDWGREPDGAIRVWHVGVDVRGAADPAAEWRGGGRQVAQPAAFNWKRGLA